MILDSEVGALLSVKPLTLRDPHLAIACAEHQALLTRRKEPGVLHSVAQAYRFAGQIEKARAVAAEGLALFAPAVPGAPIPRMRKLLELETEMKASSNDLKATAGIARAFVIRRRTANLANLGYTVRAGMTRALQAPERRPAQT